MSTEARGIKHLLAQLSQSIEAALRKHLEIFYHRNSIKENLNKQPMTKSVVPVWLFCPTDCTKNANSDENDLFSVILLSRKIFLQCDSVVWKNLSKNHWNNRHVH